MILNSLNYQRKLRLKRKIKLESDYAEILKKNGSNKKSYTESRLLNLEKQCDIISEKCDIDEMNNKTYMHIFQRQQRLKLQLCKILEETKEDLKVTDYIGVEAAKVNDLVTTKKENQKKEIEEIKRDIKEKTKQYESIIDAIEKSRERVQKLEEQKKISKQKEKKIVKKIETLKERREYYELMIKKYRKYNQEYLKNFNKLRETYRVNNKEEINNKLEKKEIEEQTANTQHDEKLKNLLFLSSFYSTKKEESDFLKILNPKGTSVNKESILDKGEYNRNILAYTYVINTQKIREGVKMLEEKYTVLRSVISGVKHLLNKLIESDKDLELGFWHDFGTIADIGDISTADMRPKISKLLLILEQKIISFCITTQQKVEHSKRFEEIQNNSEEVIPFYIPNTGIREFCIILNNLAISNKGYRRKIFRRSTLSQINFCLPMVGLEIPKCNNMQQKKRQSKEDKKSQENINTQLTKTKSEKFDDPFSETQEFDMQAMNSHMLNFITKGKTDRAKEISNIELSSKEINELKQENNKIINKFTKKRKKRKLEITSQKEKNIFFAETKKPVKNVVVHKKKRVTELTVQIEKEMQKNLKKLWN